jgi:hypothetical protein
MYDIEAGKLKQKSALDQLRWDLENKFSFSEILVEALMKRLHQFLEDCSFVDENGRIFYWATTKEEPPGKTQLEMKKIQIRLTINHPDDVSILKQAGIRAVRRKRLMRLTNEANEQGALLTQEDLALLLCNSPRTIRYDIRQIRVDGIDVPTRGQMKDIGKGVSHKARIVLDYLKGYTYPEIRFRTQHTDESIDRYIRDFSRVAYLLKRNEPILNIRQVTGMSESLVLEYKGIFEEYSKQDCPILKELLTKVSSKKMLHRKKRGGGLG